MFGSLVTTLTTLIPLAISFVAAINPITIAIAAAGAAVLYLVNRFRDLQKEYEEYNEVVGDFEPIAPFVPTTTPTTPTTPTIERSTIPERIEPIKALKVELQSIPDVLDKIDVSFSETFTKMERMAMMVSSTIRNAFLSTADASEQSSKQMIASAKNAAREQIKIALATAVAEQMKSIFASVPFPFNLALAAGAGSIVGSLFSKVIPAFAEGGLVSGATLGMVGEGPGTSMSNPEVIAPLNKLKSMIGGGGDGVQVFGTISGADILLSSDRAKNNRNRTRGY